MGVSPSTIDGPVLVSADASVALRSWNARYVAAISLVHGLALLALLPWFISWSGVLLALSGIYVFGTLGINLCFHRLLTHRSFECPRFLERALAVLGICCLQDTPAYWVAVHRVHHQHSDASGDPHSPCVAFWWSHMGWLLRYDSRRSRLTLVERYAKDLLRDSFYLGLERDTRWLWINVVQWLAYWSAGFAVGFGVEGTAAGGCRLGTSWLLWGVAVRTVLVWHITWSVNSVTHVWGYQNYETGDQSRNNVLIGLVSNGEGWHNNHHAEPRAAAHGHRWWELDVTYATIRALSWVGLARNIVRPRAIRLRR